MIPKEQFKIDTNCLDQFSRSIQKFNKHKSRKLQLKEEEFFDSGFEKSICLFKKIITNFAALFQPDKNHEEQKVVNCKTLKKIGDKYDRWYKIFDVFLKLQKINLDELKKNYKLPEDYEKKITQTYSDNLSIYNEIVTLRKPISNFFEKINQIKNTFKSHIIPTTRSETVSRDNKKFVPYVYNFVVPNDPNLKRVLIQSEEIEIYNQHLLDFHQTRSTSLTYVGSDNEMWELPLMNFEFKKQAIEERLKASHLLKDDDALRDLAESAKTQVESDLEQQSLNILLEVFKSKLSVSQITELLSQKTVSGFATTLFYKIKLQMGNKSEKIQTPVSRSIYKIISTPHPTPENSEERSIEIHIITVLKIRYLNFFLGAVGHGLKIKGSQTLFERDWRIKNCEHGCSLSVETYVTDLEQTSEAALKAISDSKYSNGIRNPFEVKTFPNLSRKILLNLLQTESAIKNNREKFEIKYETLKQKRLKFFQGLATFNQQIEQLSSKLKFLSAEQQHSPLLKNFQEELFQTHKQLSNQIIKNFYETERMSQALAKETTELDSQNFREKLASTTAKRDELIAHLEDFIEQTERDFQNLTSKISRQEKAIFFCAVLDQARSKIKANDASTIQSILTDPSNPKQNSLINLNASQQITCEDKNFLVKNSGLNDWNRTPLFYFKARDHSDEAKSMMIGRHQNDKIDGSEELTQAIIEKLWFIFESKIAIYHASKLLGQEALCGFNHYFYQEMETRFQNGDLSLTRFATNSYCPTYRIATTNSLGKPRGKDQIELTASVLFDVFSMDLETSLGHFGYQIKILMRRSTLEKKIETDEICPESAELLNEDDFKVETILTPLEGSKHEAFMVMDQELFEDYQKLCES